MRAAYGLKRVLLGPGSHTEYVYFTTEPTSERIWSDDGGEHDWSPLIEDAERFPTKRLAEQYAERHFQYSDRLAIDAVRLLPKGAVLQ